jgi:hypothetical protein
VVVAGTLTAWLAGPRRAGRDAVLAVKEDWYAPFFYPFTHGSTQ